VSRLGIPAHIAPVLLASGSLMTKAHPMVRRRSKPVPGGEWRTGGAAAVAVQIPGVSSRARTGGADLIVHEAPRTHRETRDNGNLGKRRAAGALRNAFEPRGTGASIRRTAE